MTMNTLNKLLEITSRLEYLEHSAEWIARETVHSDNAISQTATMIQAVADDIQSKVSELVKKMEELREMGPLH